MGGVPRDHKLKYTYDTRYNTRTCTWPDVPRGREDSPARYFESIFFSREEQGPAVVEPIRGSTIRSEEGEAGEKGMDPIGRRDYCAEKIDRGCRRGCSAALPASARRGPPGELDAIDRVRRQEHTFMYLLRLITRALSPRAVNVYILMYVRVCIYLYILYIYIYIHISYCQHCFVIIVKCH